MTVLAERYETRKAIGGRRFMSESRRHHMEALQERIGRDEYAVDANLVAAAIVQRLAGGVDAAPGLPGADQCS
jgi:hypothetical protein